MGLALHPTEVLFQHDSAGPHMSLKMEAIIKCVGTLLHHSPYSPNLASSDFHIFGALKDAIHGVKFETLVSVIV